MKTSNRFFLLTAVICLLCVSCTKKDPSLKIHYTFGQSSGDAVRNEADERYGATLKNGAQVKTIGRFAVMDLGDTDGYLELDPSVGELLRTLEDFSISTFLYIAPEAAIRSYGNFVWAFSTLEACGPTSGEYIAYRVNEQRYEQSSGGWENEVVGIMPKRPSEQGVWQHIVYAQSGKTGRLYVDGETITSGEALLQPKDLTEPTRFHWLGRAPFKGDVYLKAMYHDFRIYDRALDASEIQSLAGLNKELNAALSDRP